MGIAPTVILGSLAGLASWLVWKIVGTVWQIDRAIDNTLLCLSARRRWLLFPDQIFAVRGDAYGLFLVLVTAQGKIWLWARMGDRAGLLAAIRRSSPRVDLDRYAERRRL